MEEKNTKFKPFDIVRTYDGANDEFQYGIVTETDGEEASVEWFNEKTHLHTAWWTKSELEVVNNAIAIIANEMAHPFGENTKQGDILVGNITDDDDDDDDE